MRRQHAGTLIAAAAVIATIAAPAAAPETAAPAAAARDTAEVRAPDREITVMSFTIHAGIGVDGELDLQRVADVVDDQNLDLVGLQEVDRHWGARSDFVDQAISAAILP